MDADLTRRLDELRERVDAEGIRLRELLRTTKGITAEASALRDQALALVLASRGVLDEPEPPIPTHPPAPSGA